MWRPDAQALGRHLTAHFGLEIEGETKAAAGPYPAVWLTPSGLPKADSFAVRLSLGWRSIAADLVPGSFAGPLLRSMGHATEGQRATFVELATRYTGSKAQVGLSVNGAPVAVQDASTWPADWQRLELTLSKSPAVVNTEDHEDNDRELFLWGRRFMSLCLALMPLEELEPPESFNDEGLPEGAKLRVEVNRYERSRVNRAACIEIHGDCCKACGFNFGRSYGALGEGFIVVHHVVPVSKLGPDYRVNPAKDLVPLCANCHAIAHRTDPPQSVSAIRSMIGYGQGAAALQPDDG